MGTLGTCPGPRIFFFFVRGPQLNTTTSPVRLGCPGYRPNAGKDATDLSSRGTCSACFSCVVWQQRFYKNSAMFFVLFCCGLRDNGYKKLYNSTAVQPRPENITMKSYFVSQTQSAGMGSVIHHSEGSEIIHTANTAYTTVDWSEARWRSGMTQSSVRFQCCTSSSQPQ